MIYCAALSGLLALSSRGTSDQTFEQTAQKIDLGELQEIEIKVPDKKSVQTYQCKGDEFDNLKVTVLPLKDKNPPEFQKESVFNGEKHITRLEPWHLLTGLHKYTETKERKEEEKEVSGDIKKLAKFKVGDQFKGKILYEVTEKNGHKRSLTRIVDVNVMPGKTHEFKGKTYSSVAVRASSHEEDGKSAMDIRFDYSPELQVSLFFEVQRSWAGALVCRLKDLK
jgi:hypothetical protein